MKEVSPVSEVPRERPDEFWRRIYLAVVVWTIIVVTLMWAFSKYFGR